MSSDEVRPSKEEWLEEAEKAYERAFGERDRKHGRPSTFVELEEAACEEGDRLTRWLLEKKIGCESESCNSGAQPCTAENRQGYENEQEGPLYRRSRTLRESSMTFPARRTFILSD